MNAQDLKNSILQLAIQGKVVEQRKEEGTAKELLEKIKIEREQLIKEKKYKKAIPLPEITGDELPFDIPESWEWVRLSDICLLEDGVKVQNVSLPYLEARYIRGKSEPQIKTSGKYVDKNQFVILVDGENSGEVFLTKEEGLLGSTFKVLNINKSMHDEYLINLLKYYQRLFKERKRGAAIPHLDKNLFRMLVVGVPPLEEQKRIVGKIEELMPYVEKYDKAFTKVEELNKKFPEDMQKSILQYAILGKLVQQREEEGTAEELYQQIQEEKVKLLKEGKIKKQKPLTEITEDDIPFEIPKNWKWVRFSDIATFLNGDRGKNYPNKNEYVNEGVPWINTGHITKDGYLTTKTMNYISEAKYESLGGGKIQPGDLVYCLRGATFGKTARIEPYEKGAIASSLMIIRLTDIRIREYIFLYLRSSIAYNQLRQYDNGSAQPNLAAKDVAKYIIPLPPLEEQKRIVAKVEELMSYCQQLVK
jgi:type I restriction enzyme, S subunit